jgi:hypothetical protein
MESFILVAHVGFNIEGCNLQQVERAGYVPIEKKLYLINERSTKTLKEKDTKNEKRAQI